MLQSLFKNLNRPVIVAISECHRDISQKSCVFRPAYGAQPKAFFKLVTRQVHQLG